MSSFRGSDLAGVDPTLVATIFRTQDEKPFTETESIAVKAIIRLSQAGTNLAIEAENATPAGGLGQTDRLPTWARRNITLSRLILTEARELMSYLVFDRHRDAVRQHLK